MSALTDFIRQCHEPQVEALQTRIAALEAQLAEAKQANAERSTVRDSLINWLGGVHSLKSRLSGRSRTSLYPHQSLEGELLRRSEEMLEETIDMARQAIDALSALEATPPAPPGWSRETEDDGSEYLNPPNGWLKTELTTPPAPKDPWPVHYANTTAPGRFAPPAPKVTEVRPLDDWHEDYGDVVWWARLEGEWIGEAAWIGTPNDSDWPGYHTHWSAHPPFPAALTAAQEAGKP